MYKNALIAVYFLCSLSATAGGVTYNCTTLDDPSEISFYTFYYDCGYTSGKIEKPICSGVISIIGTCEFWSTATGVNGAESNKSNIFVETVRPARPKNLRIIKK